VDSKLNTNSYTATSDSTVECNDQLNTFFQRAMISWIVSTGTVVVYVTTREILRSHQLLTFTTIIDWVLAFA